MRSLIVCEGKTDLYVIQRYLEKILNWKYVDKSALPDRYGGFPDESGENPKFETCKKGDDYVDICAAGTIERMDEGFGFLYRLNQQNLNFPVTQIFIIIDRDKREIEDRLKKIITDARRYGVQINKLQNEKSNKFELTFGVETYLLNVIPIIIPFDEYGSLETLLLKSIGGKNDEKKYVTSLAENYVESYIDMYPDKKKRLYLKKDKLPAKAKLSAAISITHPDRTAVPFRELVMSHNWEEHKLIKEHFKMLNELL